MFFNNLINIILDRDPSEHSNLEELVPILSDQYGDEYAAKLLQLFDSPDDIPPFLRKYKGEIKEVSRELKSNKCSARGFLVLSMLNLTRYQLMRIWNNELHAEGLTTDSISDNPYLLFEDYNSLVETEEEPSVEEEKIAS